MEASSGPGPLAAVHRLTIGTAFVGAIAYLAFEAHAWAQGRGAILNVGLALAGTVVIGVYLRHLRARLAAKLTPPDARA